MHVHSNTAKINNISRYTFGLDTTLIVVNHPQNTFLLSYSSQYSVCSISYSFLIYILHPLISQVIYLPLINCSLSVLSYSFLFNQIYCSNWYFFSLTLFNFDSYVVRFFYVVSCEKSLKLLSFDVFFYVGMCIFDV
ncbi:hypothetical protein RND81_02G133600 [Saponaria officinalis]|uniref:Uncharacterized protein n=1 Tax=Saponaria officinalis TaxID=3572 RepID=A0AAW1MTC2_SAPOF